MSQTHSTTRRYIRLFRDAVRGEQKEFTSGSIDKAIFMLAIPMVLEMLMESLFAVVDVFFVSHLGVDAVATVGLTESLLTIIYSLGIGLSMAATAVVSRRVGEQRPGDAAHAAMQAIYICLGLSVLIGLAGLIWAEDLLLLMGLEPHLAAANSIYARIMLGSNAVIMLLFLINGIFRGAGDASIAMRSLWLANILNIILCPLLIYGWGPFPQWGLMGAAIATTIGRGIGVAYQLWHMFRGRGVLRVRRRHLSPDLPVIRNLLKVAAGGTAQFLINSASWIFLVRIISGFGADALAGYTIGIRIIVFAILPSMGMSNAAATLVGQNLGAGQPDRAARSVWRTAFLNMLFMGSLSVLFFIGAEPVIGLFNKDPEVLRYGVQCLQYVCLGYIFYAYGMVMVSSFNGAGDTRTPTILNLFGFWGLQIPLAYVLAITMELGPKGVFMAIAIAESCIALVAILLFRKGRWKRVQV